VDVVVESDGYKPTQGISMSCWCTSQELHMMARCVGELARNTTKRGGKNGGNIPQTMHSSTGSGGEVDDHLALG